MLWLVLNVLKLNKTQSVKTLSHRGQRELLSKQSSVHMIIWWDIWVAVHVWYVVEMGDKREAVLRAVHRLWHMAMWLQ